MKLNRFALAAALALASLGAQATTVTLSSITGAWFDANPGSNITSTSGSSTANASIRWTQSGYDFNAVSSASAVLPPNPSADFSFGTFTHINQPVFQSITDVKLRVTANVDVDGTNVGALNFVYQFLHDETPNGDAPCADGGTVGVGVNINGCADNVKISFLDASDSFSIGGELYTINISGFEVGGVKVNQFWTAEQQSNSAFLLANVVRRSDLTVPEPASLALVGLGLLGAGLARRRSA